MQAGRPAGNLFLEEAWLGAFAAHQPAGPVAIRTLAQGDLALAFSVGRERVRRLDCRVMRVLGDPLADQCWFGPGRDWDWAACVTALADRPDWDVAILSEMRGDADTRARIDAALAARGLSAHWRQCGRAPVVPLSPEGKPLTDKDYSSTLRRRLKRSRKKLTEAGAVTVVHKLPDPDEALTLLDTLKQIEDGSWKGDADTGLFGDATLPFVRDLSQRLAAQGMLEIYLLLLDGTPISYRYGFRHAGRFLDYNLAYLSDYHHLSPGRILLDEIVQNSQKLGLEAVDASRGSMERPHILVDWPGHVRDHHRLMIFAPTLKGRLLRLVETRIRPLALRVRKRLRGSG